MDLGTIGNGLCSGNKGADQLCGFRTADLRLCFRICKKQVFSSVDESDKMDPKRSCLNIFRS